METSLQFKLKFANIVQPLYNPNVFIQKKRFAVSWYRTEKNGKADFQKLTMGCTMFAVCSLLNHPPSLNLFISSQGLSISNRKKNNQVVLLPCLMQTFSREGNSLTFAQSSLQLGPPINHSKSNGNDKFKQIH